MKEKPVRRTLPKDFAGGAERRDVEDAVPYGGDRGRDGIAASVGDGVLDVPLP
ncbi:MAG: hypothetical protein LBL86_03470 [Coriobacteriales bacterium]|nr:hypothetical protein [Coriobacteriales bacterium]